MTTELVQAQCYCDPSFAGVSYNSSRNDEKCGLYETGCWIHNLSVFLSFFCAAVYIAICIFLSFKIALRNRSKLSSIRDVFSTRHIVFFLMLLTSILRFIRYLIMILNKEIVEDNRPLLLALDLLYSAALAVGVMGYVFLICVWMKFYKDIISSKANVSTGWFLRNFVKIYLILNLFATFVFVVSFVTETAISSTVIRHTFSSIWLLVQISIQTIFLIIYGRRITRTIREFSAAVPSDIEKFKRLHWLTSFATIWFLLSTMLLLAGAIMVYFTESLPIYIFRHSVYRLCEVILVFSIVKALQPSFRNFCVKSADDSSLSRTRNTEPTELPVMDNSQDTMDEKTMM